MVLGQREMAARLAKTPFAAYGGHPVFGGLVSGGRQRDWADGRCHPQSDDVLPCNQLPFQSRVVAFESGVYSWELVVAS